MQPEQVHHSLPLITCSPFPFICHSGPLAPRYQLALCLRSLPYCPHSNCCQNVTLLYFAIETANSQRSNTCQPPPPSPSSQGHVCAAQAAPHSSAPNASAAQARPKLRSRWQDGRRGGEGASGF